MFELFDKLNMLLYEAPLIAVTASFIWGIMSILLSPCHLSAIPIVVGFINESPDLTTKKAFQISFTFSLGLMITLILIGIISFSMGLFIGIGETIISVIMMLILIYIGLYFWDFVPLPNMAIKSQGQSKNKLISAFGIGLIFGISLGPCALAFFAPVLSIATSAVKDNPLFAGAMITAFIVSHTGVIILAGSMTNFLKKKIFLNKMHLGTKIVRRFCGTLLVLAAIYNLTNLIK